MKLSIKDIKFLSRNLRNRKLLSKLQNVDNEETTIVNFTQEQLETLEDELSELLWEIGFSDDEKITSQGIYIENLIDLVRNDYD